MTASTSKGQSIRLKAEKIYCAPSGRIPAGIYVSVKVNPRRCWKSATRVLSSDKSVAWGDTVILSRDTLPTRLSLEIRASFELGRMLGNGEIVSKIDHSWNELLLDYGDDDDEDEDDEDEDDDNEDEDDNEDDDDDEEGVDLYFTLKTTVVRARGIELHHFQFVLDRCLVGHPDRAAALTNLAWARLQGHIRNDLQDIDSTIFLFRDALALRPQGHPDRPSSIYHLTEALTWRYSDQDTPADIRESVQLYHELLPLCLEGTYLRSVAAGDDGIDHVINECNDLPTDASDDGIQLRRVQSKHALMNAASIEDLEESIKLGREARFSCAPEGHPDRPANLNTLATSIGSRFNHQGKSDDLDEAISLFEESTQWRTSDWHQVTPTQGYPERIKAAIEWASQAEVYQHESALEAYQMCLELFDDHVMTRSSIISRRASCAIRRNDLQRAAELEEQGRGQQWSLASRLRTPLDDLKSASLPLAHKLSELSKRLSDAQGSASSADRAAADRAATEYRKIAEQWEAAVVEVRNLQGFSRFLLPLSYEDLQVAARHGPVIILIASEYSRNAMIVPTSGKPIMFPSQILLSQI
ncbi:hypothetical protein DFJ58DRAFT_744323 [Suillus subalutaceus]|uniref:uncharacterized protein n=1 Tax=Suillus subalutaceus TaxID=48586 RepID=UPI001B8801E8|nr:uncharacterized protein DFJ58DRAFT_744323 [Suillus subalutaceus]KAG1861176.1 hypothetical protein DFJ58DRAFT_744323 [Suillus subalutaceus]